MNKQTLPNLNVLRGFLAICVVLLHIPLMSKNLGLPYFNAWPIFQKGYPAVWVFFTLSGYLIIHLLYQEKVKTGTVLIKQFYGRRILRIYPVYFLVLFFGIAYYQFLLPALGIEYKVNYSLFEAFFWCLGFLPNVFFGLFDPGAILSVLWSIGIEEQFYLLIAPLSKWIKTSHFTFALGLFTLVYFLVYFYPAFEFLRQFRFQYFYFSFGGFIAILNQQGRISFLHFNGLLKWMLYACFFLYFFTNLFDFKYELLKHLFSMILFALFILHISSEKKYIIKHRLLNHLGSISYGIYMYHMIALNLVLFILSHFEVQNTLNGAFFVILCNVATISISILFAHYSYRFLEKRFISLKKRSGSKTAMESSRSFSI